MELTGIKCGRWTVLQRATDYIDAKGRKFPKWTCRCECGVVRDVMQQCLVSGNSKSCGCLQRESAKHIAYTHRKKYNAYIVMHDYIIMYTNKNVPFFIDFCDFGKVYKHCWHENDNGYIVTTISHKTVYLHRYILNPPADRCVDHIGGSETKHNCRRYNLRVVTYSQNGRNKIKQSNNSSGYPGVKWDCSGSKWVANVYVDGKEIPLGRFETKQEAINARMRGEDEYYGEYSLRFSRQQHEGGR